MTSDRTESLPDPNISQPCNRKLCKICAKFVYLHQPILYCLYCHNVFHGKCLKLTNDKVFILQQVMWCCTDCSVDNIIHYNCETCFCAVNVYNEQFTQCKKCYKIVHNICITSYLCLSCLPVPFIDVGVRPNCSVNINNDFYENQPYFTPFQYYEKEVVDFIPDADELSENLQNCSLILGSCSYVNVDQFRKLVNDETRSNSVLVSINIDGFKTNFDKFKVFNCQINSNKIILGYFFCETNVTEVESQPFYLEYYNKFVLDRFTKTDGKNKQKGSGIVIFLHQNLKNVKKVDKLCISTRDFECLAVEVVTRTEKLLLLGGYHSPSGNFDKFIELYDEVMTSLNNFKDYKCITFGDFNVNLYNVFSKRGSTYIDTLFSNNFLPLISRATHFSGINPTCLDHICANELTIIKSTGLITYNFNHHLPVFVTLDLHIDDIKLKNQKPKIRINEFVVQCFADDLKQLFGQLDLSAGESAETCFTLFYKHFRTSYDKWFVNNTPCNNNSNKTNLRKDWITIGLAKSSAIKQSLYNVWANDKTSKKWNTYIEYKRVYDKLLNKTRYDYFDKKLKDSQHDLKKTWQLINGILGRKRSNRLLSFPNSDAAHNFNAYFVNVANNLIERTYSTNPEENDGFKKYMPESNSAAIDDMDFLVEDVNYIISQLHNNKSTYFSPRVLKLVSQSLSPMLTSLFNKCRKDGYFPNELKIAKVIPLYKNKGKISEISNYRPISMLSVFSKIFEKLIQKQLNHFLDSNEIMNHSQYGFRRKHSTLHALINAAENISQSIDNKHSTLGIFIDFSRASDTINHSILLKKLET